MQNLRARNKALSHPITPPIGPAALHCTLAAPANNRTIQPGVGEALGVPRPPRPSPPSRGCDTSRKFRLIIFPSTSSRPNPFSALLRQRPPPNLIDAQSRRPPHSPFPTPPSPCPFSFLSFSFSFPFSSSSSSLRPALWIC